KSTRKFEKLNDGERFPYEYDRRHDLSIVASYDLNDRWDLGMTFVYATGSAYTLPTSRYLIEGKVVNNYGERNNFRLPDYHRLDISATLQGKRYKKVKKPKSDKLKKIKKDFVSSWSFSIFNVYNRKNAYFIYLDGGSIEKEPTANLVYLFPILPSVTWNFKF
ncbi:MAG: TonB-dependent receptor, partial [Flavobacteriales bacterium]